MEMLKQIIQYAYIIFIVIELCLIMSVCTYKLIKRSKSKKEELSQLELAKEEVSAVSKTLDEEKAFNLLINEIVPASIELAEHSGIIGPKQKKLIALSDCMLKCTENNIDWQSVAEFVSNKIEDLIKFSKEVNSRKVR